MKKEYVSWVCYFNLQLDPTLEEPRRPSRRIGNFSWGKYGRDDWVDLSGREATAVIATVTARLRWNRPKNRSGGVHSLGSSSLTMIPSSSGRFLHSETSPLRRTGRDCATPLQHIPVETRLPPCPILVRCHGGVPHCTASTFAC